MKKDDERGKNKKNCCDKIVDKSRCSEQRIHSFEINFHHNQHEQ